MDATCEHFERSAPCLMVFDCCGGRFKCIRCHEAGCQTEGRIDMPASIVCGVCWRGQSWTKRCSHCGAEFATYACEACSILDSSTKQKWHCNECGVCRTGKPDGTYRHCNRCKQCIEVRSTTGSSLGGGIPGHRCFEGCETCPICAEDFATSFKGSIKLRCAHQLHPQCWPHGVRACPFCRESIAGPVAPRYPLPGPDGSERERRGSWCSLKRLVTAAAIMFAARASWPYIVAGLKFLSAGSANADASVSVKP